MIVKVTIIQTSQGAPILSKLSITGLQWARDRPGRIRTKVYLKKKG